MKVLVFGFDPREQQALEQALMRLGHETVPESDCSAAHAVIEERGIRLVIGDGRVPKFAWLDLCRRLRADPRKPHVHIILLAGASEDESHEEWAAASGVDDFLADPGDDLELRRRLRVAIRVAGLFQRIRLLESTLPICSYCKRIRDGADHWVDIGAYAGKRRLSPAVCPECYVRNFRPEPRVVRVSGSGLGGPAVN